MSRSRAQPTCRPRPGANRRIEKTQRGNPEPGCGLSLTSAVWRQEAPGGRIAPRSTPQDLSERRRADDASVRMSRCCAQGRSSSSRFETNAESPAPTIKFNHALVASLAVQEDREVEVSLQSRGLAITADSEVGWPDWLSVGHELGVSPVLPPIDVQRPFVTEDGLACRDGAAKDAAAWRVSSRGSRRRRTPLTHSRSPGLRRRLAAMARSEATARPYRDSISRDFQPASCMRSPSFMPAVSAALA